MCYGPLFNALFYKYASSVLTDWSFLNKHYHLNSELQEVGIPEDSKDEEK
mgnify:CR=1